MSEHTITNTSRTPDHDDFAGTAGPAIRVSGGAGGIQARYDDIRALGRVYASIGPTLLGYAWEDKREAMDADLLASAVLSPETFAAAEEAIVKATYGPQGLVARATVIEAQALAFVAVVEFYELAEEARSGAIEALHYGFGFSLGFMLPGAAVLTAGTLLANPTLTLALGLTAGTQGDEVLEELSSHLEDHPEAMEMIVGGGGGLLDGLGANPITGPLMGLLGLGGFHPDTGAAAGDLGDLLFQDHEGTLNPDYDGPTLAHEPPRDVEDLLEDLGTTAGQDLPNGVISIQTITQPDGSVSHIVQLPGTDDFFAQDEIRNMGSNLNLIAGESTAYGQAIQQAMQEAGVGPNDPVMLVGHSQGGMQAAALAADPSFGYDVTHVVTAGSPVATAGVPDDVQVLSLENTGDVVPLLDGQENDADAHHTTVHADIHSGSFGAGDGQNHSMSTYESIASSVDSSTEPSLQQVVGSMHDEGFLSGPGAQVTSTTQTFQTVLGDQLPRAGRHGGSMAP